MAISVMTWVWNHSRSRHGARLVLLAIADCASADGGNAWPSNAELRRKSGLGERAVQSAVAELTALGELEVRYNAGPKGCNAYRVIMDGDPRNICTPADFAPPQRLRGSKRDGKKSPQADTPDELTPAESAPPQILRSTPAISAPVTVLEPKPKNSPAESSRARDRAQPSAGVCEIPDDFAATDAMRRWAHSTYPGLDLDFETQQFCRHYRSTGQRRRSWPDAWQKWIADSHKRASSRPQAALRNAHQPSREEFDALRNNWARPLDAMEAGIDPGRNGRPDRVHGNHLPGAEDKPVISGRLV